MCPHHFNLYNRLVVQMNGGVISASADSVWMRAYEMMPLADLVERVDREEK